MLSYPILFVRIFFVWRVLLLLELYFKSNRSATPQSGTRSIGPIVRATTKHLLISVCVCVCGSLHTHTHSHHHRYTHTYTRVVRIDPAFRGQLRSAEAHPSHCFRDVGMAASAAAAKSLRTEKLDEAQASARSCAGRPDFLPCDGLSARHGKCFKLHWCCHLGWCHCEL